MSLDDIVSLIIAVVAIVYSLLSMSKLKRPILDSFEDEDEEEEEVRPPRPVQAPKPVAKSAPPTAPQSVEKKFVFRSQLDEFSQHTAIEDRHLEIHLRPSSELVSDAFRLEATEGAVVQKAKKPTVHELIKSLPQEKLLFISYEVFHVPVSRRPSPFPWNG